MILFALLTCFSVLCCHLVVAGNERKLAKKLLEDYQASGSKYGRPVKDDKEIMKVKLGLAILHFDVDEEENLVTMVAWPQAVRN